MVGNQAMKLFHYTFTSRAEQHSFQEPVSRIQFPGFTQFSVLFFKSPIISQMSGWLIFLFSVESKIMLHFFLIGYFKLKTIKTNDKIRRFRVVMTPFSRKNCKRQGKLQRFRSNFGARN